MENENDAFYVVRKGGVVGVYKNFTDCQALLGSSVFDLSVSVFKGYGLPKTAEEYLALHGLKNAVYTVGVSDVDDRLFGELAVCPFQQPACTKGNSFNMNSAEKRPQGHVYGSSSCLAPPQSKHAKLQDCIGGPIISCSSCILEFDGASKGNPGLSGAGAVLSAEDGSWVYRLREGVGIATNNVAEYRALILGLKFALKKGFKHIRVQGDSNLVVMQVQGLWKTKNANMAELCKVAKELKDKFASFQIRHVDREFNSAADAQANLATKLKNGEIQEDLVST